MINEPDTINYTATIVVEGIDLDTTTKTIDPTIVPYGLAAVMLISTICIN